MSIAFNSPSWSAYINIKDDGKIALRLPAVKHWCPIGKTVIFEFNDEGIKQAIEAMYQHQHYLKTPLGKAELTPSFMRNLSERLKGKP